MQKMTLDLLTLQDVGKHTHSLRLVSWSNLAPRMMSLLRCINCHSFAAYRLLIAIDSSQVKYANSNSIGFLAKNRGHGSTKTLGQLKNGIEINIRVLDQIIISADGTSAFMGGGVYDDQVMRTLWNAGYVTGRFAVGVMNSEC